MRWFWCGGGGGDGGGGWCGGTREIVVVVVVVDFSRCGVVVVTEGVGGCSTIKRFLLCDREER